MLTFGDAPHSPSATISTWRWSSQAQKRSGLVPLSITSAPAGSIAPARRR